MNDIASFDTESYDFWPDVSTPQACRAGLLPALAACCLLAPCFDAPSQTLERTQEEFCGGHYESVIETAGKNVAAGGYSDGWDVLLVQSQLALGQYAAARSNALAAVEDFPTSIQLRLLAREADVFQNDLAGAQQQLTEIKLLIERRGRINQNGESLVALGRALLLLGVEPRLVLENCFRPACDMDPPIRDAYLASGQLALDKHDFPLAADTFRAGLKKFPDDADLEGGLAGAFATGDSEQMRQALEAALAANPRHVPSLLLLADYLIDSEKYDEAQQQLDRALAVNPRHPEALAYQAVLEQLRNNPAAAEKSRSGALQYWQTNPQVDYIIGLKLAQKYLFEEGAAAQRRALAFEPGYLPARRELAEDLLRLGQTDEGWKLAQEARADDEYDVLTYNLTALHDEMTKFRTLTNADFILRMSPLEADLYGDRALDLLERAKSALCQKYGVELKRPTVVEIFPDQKDFAVRTFGMPGNPGYLGVCFGSVITANSPASQAPNPANWEDVLWHEFCHVVTLNDTRNRMPRWLSEGISVYEERQADPTWGPRMNLANRGLILQGKLTPLRELSGAFLQPKNSESLQFAYYESSLAVEFLARQFGLDKLKKILLDLRGGDEVNQAIVKQTVPMADLDKQFAAFARAQAENLAPDADLDKPPAEAGDLAAAAWEKLHPNNYNLKLQKAKELMEAKKWTEAEPLLRTLAASYHGERGAANPWWLESLVERNLNDTNAEWDTLQKFAAQEGDFAELDERLIELAGARRDWSAETKYAERLLQINPLVAAPYRGLAEAAAGSGDKAQAIDAWRRLLLLDPPDPAQAHFQLALLLHERGGAENEAKRHVLQALEDAPRYRDAQRLLLKIEAAYASQEVRPASKPDSDK